MSLKVLVHKTDESAPQPDTYVFHQERIIIGRDSANDLPLMDLKRVVSKQHAELVTSGETIHLTDLGSKNFTYLNGDRLQSGLPYPVNSGDTVQIGDFEIKIEMMEVASEPEPPTTSYDDRTVFDASFVNPFEDSVKLLAVALRSLSKQYDAADPGRRDEALEEALRAALDGSETHTTFEVLGRLLVPATVVAPPVTPPSVTPPKPEPPVTSPPPKTPPSPRESTTAPVVPENVIDLMMQSVARLVGVPWQFRHEFIGQTIMQSEETAFLYEGDAEELKRHLLDPTLSGKERLSRKQLLEEALADVERHQVAMLDGYKAGVREGGLRLIDQLNPDLLEQEVAGENVLYRLVRPLAKAEALKRLRNQLIELRSEDWSAAERRTYRPAFIKAYLARMTSAR